MNSIIDDLKAEFNKGNMLTRIIFINAFVFLAFNLIRVIFYFSGNTDVYDSFISNWLVMPVNPSLVLFKPWTIITHIFLHASLGHIFFNMLTLYWFGKIFTEYLNEKKLLPTFIYGGIAGGLLSVISYFILPEVNPYGTITGASGAVLAILVATATLIPDYTIGLMFIGPVRIKYIALVLVGIDLISIPNNDHTAHFSHIGGAIFGYFYIKQLQKGNDWSVGFNKLFEKIADLFKPKTKIKIVHKKGRPLSDDEFKENKKVKQETIDRILDKISKSGYESLSKDEKDILFKMSKE